jgi:ribosomal protein L37E
MVRRLPGPAVFRLDSSRGRSAGTDLLLNAERHEERHQVHGRFRENRFSSLLLANSLAGLRPTFAYVVQWMIKSDVQPRLLMSCNTAGYCQSPKLRTHDWSGILGMIPLITRTVDQLDGVRYSFSGRRVYSILKMAIARQCGFTVSGRLHARVPGDPTPKISYIVAPSYRLIHNDSGPCYES